MNLPARIVSASLPALAALTMLFSSDIANAQAQSSPSTIAGTVSRTDPNLEEGHPTSVQHFTLQAGTTTIVVAGGASSEHAGQPFDPVTSVSCRGSAVRRDDNGGGHLNARVVVRVAARAACTIRVYGSGGDLGDYTIHFLRGDVSLLRGAATIEGELTRSDLHLDDEAGRLFDGYPIVFTAHSPVTIVTRGGESTANRGQRLDVVTSLICDGQQVARDDDGAGYPNSRIVYEPLANQTCIVRVLGFAGDTGAYTLQVYEGSLENQI